MLKLLSSASIGTIESIIRRNKMIECYCQDDCVLRIVGDMNSVNFEKRFLGCRNYKNHMNKDCNFFKWLDGELLMKEIWKFKGKKFEESGYPY